MHDFKPNRVLVLGSNSFGGASTVKHFLDKGCQVWGASRSEEPRSFFLPYTQSEHLKQFEFHQLDLNQDFDVLCRLTEKVQPDTILDFAGQGMVAQSWQQPEQWYQTNIVAKVKYHNFLLNKSYFKRYVRASTPEVFGSFEGTLTEQSHFSPSTPYAVSHAAIDMSLQAFYRHHQFPMVLTRFANFYGPGQQLYRILPRAILSALNKEILPLHGGGTSVRAFIHGQDVASGIWQATCLGRIGESYHFSTDEFISIRSLVEQVAEVANVSFDSFVEIAEERPAKDKAYVMSSERAQKELEWRPHISLKEGIEQTFQWVQANLDNMQSLPRDYIHKP